MRQEEGAPSQTARNTPTDLRSENVTFIELHVWSPNTPGLESAVWGALQQMVYQRRRFRTINQLKQVIVSATNYCNISSIAPLISGVAGLTRSSRSKANKLQWRSQGGGGGWGRPPPQRPHPCYFCLLILHRGRCECDVCS